MKTKTADKYLSVFVALGCYFLIGQLEGVPVEGRIFPSAVLWLIIIACGVLFAQSLLKKVKKDSHFELWENGSFPIWLVIVVIFVSFVVGIFYIGFFTCAFLSSLLVPTILSKKDWRASLRINFLFASGLVIVFYLFFVVLMKVRFPEALLI